MLTTYGDKTAITEADETTGSTEYSPYTIEPTKITEDIYNGYPTIITESRGTRGPSSLTTAEIDIPRPTMPHSSYAMETAVFISTVQTEGEFQAIITSREAIAWALVFLITLMFIGLISANCMIVACKYWKRQRSNKAQNPLQHEMIDTLSYKTPDTSDKNVKISTISINEASEAKEESNL